MARVNASVDVADATVEQAEALWYDVARWPSFVDGFAHETGREGDWPRAGARLEWNSLPGGRGRVELEVTEQEPGVGQTVATRDPQLEGSERVRFEELTDGVGVALELDYTLTRRGPLRALTDLLFIRRALRDSLRRTLGRFATELAADVAERSGSPPLR